MDLLSKIQEVRVGLRPHNHTLITGVDITVFLPLGFQPSPVNPFAQKSVKVLLPYPCATSPYLPGIQGTPPVAACTPWLLLPRSCSERGRPSSGRRGLLCPRGRRLHSRWECRGFPQTPPLPHWGHRTPCLASVTLCASVCVIGTMTPSKRDPFTSVFLGADQVRVRLGQTHCGSPGASQPRGSRVCSQTLRKEVAAVVTERDRGPRGTGKRDSHQGPVCSGKVSGGAPN